MTDQTADAFTPPAADRAALRDRIAEALADADGWKWAPGFKAESPTWHDYQARADAVLAVLPAPTDRAAVLREAAVSVQSGDVQFSTKAAEAALRNGGSFALIAYVQLAVGQHLRRMADEAQPGTEHVQHMLTRMRADATTHDHNHLLRLIACWAVSSEGRDALVEDLITAGYRLPHACGNCEGIDPDTCLKNPNRKQPAAGAQQDGPR